MFKQLSLLTATILFWAGAVTAQPVVSFSEAKIIARQGDTFSVDIVMSDFPVSQGGGLTLRYNPSIVMVKSVTVNDATWSFINQPGKINNKKGKVKDIIFSAFPGVSGNGGIATVNFEAIGTGKSRLRLKESPKNQFASNGELFAVSFKKAVVRVKQLRK